MELAEKLKVGAGSCYLLALLPAGFNYFWTSRDFYLI